MICPRCGLARPEPYGPGWRCGCCGQWLLNRPRNSSPTPLGAILQVRVTPSILKQNDAPKGQEMQQITYY